MRYAESKREQKWCHICVIEQTTFSYIPLVIITKSEIIKMSNVTYLFH